MSDDSQEKEKHCKSAKLPCLFVFLYFCLSVFLSFCPFLSFCIFVFFVFMSFCLFVFLSEKKKTSEDKNHLPAWSRPLISKLGASLSFKSVPLLLQMFCKIFWNTQIKKRSLILQADWIWPWADYHNANCRYFKNRLVCRYSLKYFKLIKSNLELIVTMPIAGSSARTSDSPPALCKVDIVHARTCKKAFQRLSNTNLLIKGILWSLCKVDIVHTRTCKQAFHQKSDYVGRSWISDDLHAQQSSHLY